MGGRSQGSKGSESQERLNDATALQTSELPTTDTQNNSSTKQPRDSNSEPVDAGLAKKSRKTTGRESVPDLFSGSSGNGTASPSGNAEHGSPSTARKDGSARDQSGTTSDLGNYEITDEYPLIKLDCLRAIK